MNEFEPTTDMATEFVALNEQLRAGVDPATAMQHLVDLAVRCVPGCQWAGITSWPVKQAPHSVVTTSDVADQVDQIQYTLSEGPCLTAALGDGPARLPSLQEGAARWPRFTAAVAASTPVRGMLAFHIADEPRRAALNLYSCTDRVFDDDAFEAAALFAAHARVLLLHARSTEQVANLQVALTTSRHIGAAIGILMNAHKITSDDAFERLRKASGQLNVKLRDVADTVTLTGELPPPPRRSPA